MWSLGSLIWTLLDGHGADSYDSWDFLDPATQRGSTLLQLVEAAEADYEMKGWPKAAPDLGWVDIDFNEPLPEEVAETLGVGQRPQKDLGPLFEAAARVHQRDKSRRRLLLALHRLEHKQLWHVAETQLGVYKTMAVSAAPYFRKPLGPPQRNLLTAFLHPCWTRSRAGLQAARRLAAIALACLDSRTLPFRTNCRPTSLDCLEALVLLLQSVVSEPAGVPGGQLPAVQGMLEEMEEAVGNGYASRMQWARARTLLVQGRHCSDGCQI